ncbi:exosortase A-associated hydrolase 1 [Undibacterium sp. GrIS 1.8]|uniref:hydrolase 1, exosortase A system-associated n=1 Tax=Undibacterium sp. GrIS 1.8 TaxID=3143934 RepID=UPI0033998C2A
MTSDVLQEQAVSFKVKGACLYGVISTPAQASPRGVLFIVGGPQYRAGSHRQFTLLARDLAANGYSGMRFDYRGMGDSEGESLHFSETTEDIKAALDYFFKTQTHLQEVVLWGLCDAASAALFYAHQDQRITGLILLNPWVRTEAGIAKTYLKHYYVQRLFTAEFWKKMLLGKVRFFTSAKSLVMQLRQAVTSKNVHSDSEEQLGLPEKMLSGLQRFKGKTCIILSENDLTAQEFSDLVSSSADWKKLLTSPRLKQLTLAGANHTFSQRKWREQVASWTTEWLKSW